MKDFYVYTLMQHKHDYSFKGDWVQARPIFDSYLLAGTKNCLIKTASSVKTK